MAMNDLERKHTRVAGKNTTPSPVTTYGPPSALSATPSAARPRRAEDCSPLAANRLSRQSGFIPGAKGAVKKAGPGACLLALAIVGAAPAVAPAAETNLVRNGSFDGDADRSGAPDGWRASGDSRLVAQKLSVDKGRDGSRCAKLECTRFTAGNPACHAMLCQMDVPVRRGMGYRLTLWGRGKDIAAETVAIAISDTRSWSNCGLNGAFAPTPQWRPYEFVFRATRDCPKGSRLQLWFGSTGTLWVDDVAMVEAGRDLYRPGNVVPSVGGARGNLVPNAGFECGTDGWGSAEWDRTRHWGGPMNRLFGQLDTKDAHQGRASLRIGLGPQNQPVSYFDYYDLCRQPIRAPLAANVGFLEVEPGKPCVLSVWMKAAAPDTPARLAVRQFERGAFSKAVRLGTRWRRYALEFKPAARWCYVLAGPDLQEAPDNPHPPDRAIVWLDAVQLEQAAAPTDFAPRAPVELGVATDKQGNIFGWDEPLRFRLAVAGTGLKRSVRATVALRLTDFFDKEVWQDSLSVDVPPSGSVEKQIELPPDERRRGFLRLDAVLSGGDVTAGRSMRLAAIPVHPGGDSRFGVNHAYPWPHLLDLSRKAGLVWVRDWSLKWQTVEPEKGRFDFTETDFQIDRPIKHDLDVLGLLPFPSSNWASSAPESVKVTDRYPGNRARVAYAPRDEAEFESYVSRTVAHYRGRVRWWQVFNEPLFTDYSLPRSKGYGGKEYARWTVAFARAARKADPDCRVLAGIGYLGEGQIMADFEQFFAAGGLKACDAVDIHHYPRLRAPEFAGKLLDELNALMDEHGGRKPIWLTEYGYYADDEPWARPMPNHGFNQPLASEEVQGAYAVRWAAIMFSRGVDKIFYHAGTCDGIDRDSLQGIFYEYAGTPHKIYAAQAVMARLLTPTCKPAGRLELGEGVHGYLFRDGPKLLAVVWSVAGAKPRPIRLAEAKLRPMDIMGRPLATRHFTPSGTPVYVLAEGVTAEAFRAGLKR